MEAGSVAGVHSSPERQVVEGGRPTDQELESTAALIGRIRAGDPAARELLVGRCLPLLRRWAHGRLPANARSLVETGDLVHLTLIRALDHLDTFVPRGEGAFLAYLRQTLMNQIRNEIKRSAHAQTGALERVHPDPRSSSPLEQIIGKDLIEKYEAALERLPEKTREAVILSLEFQLSHQELAQAIGCPTANAARMVVSRALARLAEAMDVEP